MKTSERTGFALDWAVAKCEGGTWCSAYTPSTDWAQGGSIIEREGICLIAPHDDITVWEAVHPALPHDEEYGPTPLIAAMRCYVASKMGDDIEIPQELVA